MWTLLAFYLIAQHSEERKTYNFRDISLVISIFMQNMV